jgi:hypothetical protein
MDDLRSYLLSERNFQMLEKLIVSKVSKLTLQTVEPDDPTFQQHLLMIATTIISSEIKLNPRADNNTVLKINAIIIAEVSKYISKLILEQSSSSRIEELSETESVIEPSVNDPVFEPENKLQIETIICSFDREITEVNLKNVVSVEFLDCHFDFSDYVVTENNNCMNIDNEPFNISIGNYTPESLIQELNSNSKIVFEIDKLTDNIFIQQPKVKKSMTGTIKDNQKQVNVDFGVKNSLANLLGYSPKTYIVKDQTIVSNFKHQIKHPQSMEFTIDCGTTTLKHTVPLNVKYNETIYYKPDFSKVIELSNIDIQSVNITTDYNMRGRPYSFNLKFKLVNDNSRKFI